MVQWLKLCGFDTEGMGLIPGRGTEAPTSRTAWPKTNKTKQNKAEVTLHQVYASPYPKVSKKASFQLNREVLPLTPENYLSSERKEV